jgi:hypothetical protein
MLLGVQMYFLTQDTALTAKIAPATFGFADARSAASRVNRPLCKTDRHSSIIYMRLGRWPMGMQVLFSLRPCRSKSDVAVSYVAATALRRPRPAGNSRRHPGEARTRVSSFNLPMFQGFDERRLWSFQRSIAIFRPLFQIIYGALAAICFVVKKTVT